MTTIWDLLQEMACRDGATAPVVVEGVQILDLADYLEMLLPQLEMVMRESADSSHQSWKGLVGHGRQTDVAGVLPKLADSLRRFAADGGLQDCLEGVSALMFLLLREMLRRGKLPVLFPVASLPARRIADDECLKHG
jgi:hypothetical protein